MQNKVFKALAHPDRRKVLNLLKSGPKLAGDLAAEFQSSWPTMSRHLSLLKDADLITAERQGTQILYKINTSVVEDTASRLLTLIGMNNNDNDENEGPKYEEAAE